MHCEKKQNWRLYSGEQQADMRSQPGKPPGAMVMSGPGLPHRAMSVSITLLQLESVLMSVAQVSTEGHLNISDMGCCLRLC